MKIVKIELKGKRIFLTVVPVAVFRKSFEKTTFFIFFPFRSEEIERLKKKEKTETF